MTLQKLFAKKLKRINTCSEEVKYASSDDKTNVANLKTKQNCPKVHSVKKRDLKSELKSNPILLDSNLDLSQLVLNKSAHKFIKVDL